MVRSPKPRPADSISATGAIVLASSNGRTPGFQPGYARSTRVARTNKFVAVLRPLDWRPIRSPADAHLDEYSPLPRDEDAGLRTRPGTFE